MKAKLTKITGIYTLLDDNDRMVASDDVDMQKDYEIGKLSTKNCDEIFGAVDVEKLAEEEYKSHASNEDLYGDSEELQLAYKAGVVDGFNKAMELNRDKVFTLEDIRRAMSAGLSIGYGRQFEIENKSVEIDNYIRSIKQPTEIEVMIVMESIGRVKLGVGSKLEQMMPKIDSEGCLILKKI